MNSIKHNVINIRFTFDDYIVYYSLEPLYFVKRIILPKLKGKITSQLYWKIEQLLDMKIEFWNKKIKSWNIRHIRTMNMIRISKTNNLLQK